MILKIFLEKTTSFFQVFFHYNSKKFRKICKIFISKSCKQPTIQKDAQIFFFFQILAEPFYRCGPPWRYIRKLLKKPLIPMFIVWSDSNQVHANRLTAQHLQGNNTQETGIPETSTCLEVKLSGCYSENTHADDVTRPKELWAFLPPFFPVISAG